MQEDIVYNPDDAELPISFGPFKIVENPHQYDYTLTDRNETFTRGFDAEEAADLEIVAQRLLGQIKAEATNE